jgi:Tfp pilus assembly protein PilN
MTDTAATPSAEFLAARREELQQGLQSLGVVVDGSGLTGIAIDALAEMVLTPEQLPEWRARMLQRQIDALDTILEEVQAVRGRLLAPGTPPAPGGFHLPGMP